MKVLNLTDVETPGLKQRQLLDQSFAVGQNLVSPGQSIDVPPEEESLTRMHIAHLIEFGALAIDEAPASYTEGKNKPKEPKEGEQKAGERRPEERRDGGEREPRERSSDPPKGQQQQGKHSTPPPKKE